MPKTALFIITKTENEPNTHEQNTILTYSYNRILTRRFNMKSHKLKMLSERNPTQNSNTKSYCMISIIKVKSKRKLAWCLPFFGGGLWEGALRGAYKILGRIKIAE